MNAASLLPKQNNVHLCLNVCSVVVTVPYLACLIRLSEPWEYIVNTLLRPPEAADKQYSTDRVPAET